MSLTAKILTALLIAVVVGIVSAKVALRRNAKAPDLTPAASGHGQHHDATSSSIDWTRVTDRDLDVAELFVTARTEGVGPALTKLERHAAGDTALHNMGHIIAHALGRFIVGRRDGDPAVYAECREIFQAGCNHGVMEAYFASARAATPDAVAPRALDSLCDRITRPGAARLVSLECAHGMGHGLIVRYRGDVRAALAACDHLTKTDARRECHDGVFMENAVRATASVDMRVGTAAVEAGATARQQPPLARRGDPSYPCNDIDERYRDACWTYQPIIALEEGAGDQRQLIAVCEDAPPASRDDCFFGIGKQATGWWQDEKRVAHLCESVPAPGDSACVTGAADSYLDEMWTGDRAMTFCGAVAATRKDACYETIGSRVALMRTDAATMERECARVEGDFARSCLRGVERARTTR
ncbi:MAG TPA: hypothetical protein VFU01_06555 [Gemmatimonadaceae bacterium]|nr:hypothetical protein [Gemmatimonadaceae bacterium]